MSKALFDRVFSAALTEDASFPVDSNFRWIKRKDEADAKLMSEAKVKILRLGQREVTAIIDYSGRKVFCISGYDCPQGQIVGVKEIEATPGLFSVFVTEANILSVATAAQVRDILQYQYNGVAGYDGHDLAEIIRIFPNISFWEVDATTAGDFADDIVRISGSFIVRSYGQYPLEMSPSTKGKIIRIFESGPDYLPFSLILQGVLSYSWQSVFLDLYRSIEQLYSAPRIKSFSEKFKFECTLSEIAEALESLLAWRPKEEEALTLLLQKTSKPVRTALIDAICDESGAKPEATPERCASQIYKLRNSHVHFRPALRASNLKPDKWDLIVSAMCDALLEIYDAFGADFLVRKHGGGENNIQDIVQ